VEISSGDVDLAFAEPPVVATAVAQVGDVVVTLTAGVYDVTAGASAGQERVVVDHDPAAPSKVTARTNAGDVTVRYND
jgi:hypothetical protein